MDFKSLAEKLQQIEEGICPTCGQDPCKCVTEEVTDECGMMPPMPMDNKQADSVSMNVTMSGSGSGGIRDLMNILKDIEDVQEPHHGDTGDKDALFGDSFENELDAASGNETLPVNAVLPTGDDLASKGKEAPKVNGGGNPMQAELMGKLAELYQAVKENNPKSHQAQTTLKHLKKASYGDRADAANIKPGVKGYADRIAMLQRAKEEDNLKND